jgi:hypothetical protein
VTSWQTAGDLQHRQPARHARPGDSDGRLCLRRPQAQRDRRVACRAAEPRAADRVPDGPPLPSLAIHLGRTKTSSGEQDDVVYLTGRPVEALNAWMVAAKIDSGSVFRAIGRWGTVSRCQIDPQSVNAMIKQRAAMAGFEPGEFSAHGLRSGYLTEAASRGIPLPEAMEQSRHRSVQQASSYYNNATRRSGRAARML